jgi:uncharacterized protein
VLKPLLEGLASRSDVLGAAVVSGEGLVIESALPAGSDGEALAALATTLLRGAGELGAAGGLGALGTAILEFDQGPAVVTALTTGAGLLVLARPDTDLGELLYLIRRHRAAVADLL